MLAAKTNYKSLSNYFTDQRLELSLSGEQKTLPEVSTRESVKIFLACIEKSKETPDTFNGMFYRHQAIEQIVDLEPSELQTPLLEKVAEGLAYIHKMNSMALPHLIKRFLCDLTKTINNELSNRHVPKDLRP